MLKMNLLGKGKGRWQKNAKNGKHSVLNRKEQRNATNCQVLFTCRRKNKIMKKRLHSKWKLQQKGYWQTFFKRDYMFHINEKFIWQINNALGRAKVVFIDSEVIVWQKNMTIPLSSSVNSFTEKLAGYHNINEGFFF